MNKSVPFPKPLLVALAVIFGAAVVLYSALWMYSIRWQSGVELGLDFHYVKTLHAERVRSVEPGGPAAKAGLKPGDRILAVDGHPLENPHMIFDLWSRQKPGNKVALSVVHPGDASPVILTAVFRARRSESKETGLTERFGVEILQT